MYNLPRDLALKKKKQALRRLSQSGTQGSAKPLISPINAGKKLPGTSKATSYGGQSNTNVKAKNPFQLATTSGAQQQERVNPFSSVPQASKPPQFPIQSGPLFKSSGSGPPSNPFVTSSASSFSTATSGASVGGISYAQAVNTGGSGLKDPRLERSAPPPTYTASTPDHDSYDSNTQDKQHGFQNPFAKPSDFKFSNPKMGAQGKMYAGVSRMHRPAPPTTHQYMITLSVRNIDQKMCTPEILHNHFQQFGDVCDLKCMPRKGMATVSYRDHKAALRAKQQGIILDQSYPPMHIVLQKKRPASSSQLGEGGKRKNIPSDYVWVHPSMQLAAMDDKAKEKAASKSGLPIEKPPLSSKGSIFSRLGDQIEDASKGKQGPSLKVQSEAKQKYSPHHPNQDEEYVPTKVDWEQEEYDVSDDKFTGEEQDLTMPNKRVTASEDSAGDDMDTIARHVRHSYDLRSLHRGTGGGNIDNSNTGGVVPVSLVGSVSAAVTDVPKLVLPAGPVSSLTAAKAYETLEERDAQIRKTMVKQTSLATAQAIVGTCPDMCPEKERYRRESIKRLSMFEVLSSSDPQNPQVNHTKAVKEYSGSAADKDEPLPHELRPPHVLTMTMDYLVTMVINNHSAVGSGEWFNFIWNRTRAVRKDITLQHLCSPAMAEIVEKCARFHVVCGHLMCEEDVSSFDAKMNSDNLSKCLQTLKEFYRDLRRKGIQCYNEPEFCCYDILLHLNEGDVLCKIDDYTPGIYRSPLVHFAIQVASAWSSNNFVRFFRLVRSATYLNSCLLHRYFNQVRRMTLAILSRTHTGTAKQSSYIPIADMQDKMLYMESQEQVVAFCGYHGIRTEENGDRFVLSRDAYSEPEKPYDIFRSRELVEQKNNKTFGEVIHGGPLPPVPKHIPVSTISGNTLTQLPTAITPRVIYNEKDILVVVEDVVSGVVRSEMNVLVGLAISEVQQLYVACDRVGVGLIDDVIVASCREIIQNTYAEESERIRRQKEARETLLNMVTYNFVASVVNQTTLSEIGIIARSSLEEEHVMAEIHRNAMHHVMMQMTDYVVAVEIRQVVEESVREAMVQRKQHLNFIASQVIRMRTAKYFAYWHRATLRCKQVKKCLETFPPSAPLRPLSWLLDRLQPSEKKPRLEFPTDPSSLLRSRTSALTNVIDKFNKSEEERKQFWSPISIPDLISGHLMARLQLPPPMEPANSLAHHHWQLLLVLPAMASAVDSTSIDWLKSVLSAAPSPLTTCMGAVELLSLSNDHKTKVIVKSLQGAVPSVEQEVYALPLKGTSAILLYFVGILQVDKLLEQLNSVMFNIKPYPQLPLIVLCEGEVSLAATETATIEEALCTSFPVLSAVKFIPYSLSASFSQFQQFHVHQQREELCEAVRWLALNSSLPPVLTWQPLYDYLEQGLLELYVQPLMTDHKLRLTLGVAPQPFRGVLAFYNAAVEHLSLVATSEDLAHISWPSKEISSNHFSFKGAPPIYWNESGYLAKLNEVIMSLKINPLSVHSDELSFDDCLNFVKSVCEANQVLEPLPLITNIHKMLQQQADDRCMSWAHVITMCMSHLLKSVGPNQWVCRCHKEKRLMFKEPPEWLTCVASTTLARVQHHSTPKTEHHRAKTHRRHWSDPISVSIIVNSNYCSPNVKNNEYLKKKLFSTLDQERLLNQEFDDLLMEYTSTQQ